MTDYPYQNNPVGTGTLNTPEAPVTSNERIDDAVTFLQVYAGPKSDGQLDAAVTLVCSEIGRLTRELSTMSTERNQMLEGLEALGWPCRLVELPAYTAKSDREIDRLRAALIEGLASYDKDDFPPRGWIGKVRSLVANGSPDETAGDWLTNEQCDDVIAFLEDYEWTGLTRENVRTWCTAIAEARSSVKAKPEQACCVVCHEVFEYVGDAVPSRCPQHQNGKA